MNISDYLLGVFFFFSFCSNLLLNFYTYERISYIWSVNCSPYLFSYFFDEASSTLLSLKLNVLFFDFMELDFECITKDFGFLSDVLADFIEFESDFLIFSISASFILSMIFPSSD